MANKKLIALLVTILTVSTSMFGLFEGLGRATESVVSAPVDVASGGKTWEERHERWKEEDAAKRRAAERRERRKDYEDYYDENMDDY